MMCWKASYSPWTSERKCSVPLGRFWMARRLMISVLASWTVGYCLDSSRRYSSFTGVNSRLASFGSLLGAEFDWHCDEIGVGPVRAGY